MNAPACCTWAFSHIRDKLLCIFSFCWILFSAYSCDSYLKIIQNTNIICNGITQKKPKIVAKTTLSVWRSAVERKKGFMNTVTQQHTVNKPLKPNRVLLSMHKSFELVFLICLGWQPFVPAEYNMRVYHQNTEYSLMSTLPLHTNCKHYVSQSLFSCYSDHANIDMEIQPLPSCSSF